MIFLLAYCLSFFIHSQQAKQLPDEWAVFFLPAFLAALIIHQQTEKCLTKKIAQAVIGFLLGYGWVTLYAGWHLESRLNLSEGIQDVQMEVSVEGLVVHKGNYSQFTAVVKAITPQSLERLIGQKVRLNLYHHPEVTTPSFQPCDSLRLTARLKPIRGLKNIKGFDYEAWAFSENLAAKGYVKNLIQVFSSPKACIHKIRQHFRDSLIGAVGQEKAAWLVAVTIGDRTLLSKEQMGLLKRSGLMHLFVISGLHIGLIAGFLYAFILLVRRMGGGVLIPKDWRPFALVASFAIAVIYALMAGFSYPVQRALIGLSVLTAGSLGWLHASKWMKYWLAMAICLSFSPLAPLNKGFILSFYAVFILLLIVTQKDMLGSWLGKCWLFIKLQWSLFIALLPMQLMVFSQTAVLSPLINLFMIPLMTVAIIPMSLLLFVYSFFAGVDNHGVVFFADTLFWLMKALENALTHWPFESMFDQSVGVFEFWILLGAISFLFTPWLTFFRPLAYVLLVAIIIKIVLPEKRPALAVDVLDVGQGLSVLIRTPEHQLLYDTGAGWQGGSMGEWVILPVLNHLDVKSLDTLVISHLDADHAGGFEDIAKKIAINEVVSSDISNNSDWKDCHRQNPWQWGAVYFEFISLKRFNSRRKNDQSCVLLIEYQSQKILLTGDIEKAAEQWLLDQDKLEKVNILIVPHHGSKTSSTLNFLQVLSPELAINSSGFLNRYRHPHPIVVARYKTLGIDLIDTQNQGQIQLRFDETGNVERQYRRGSKVFYWEQ